MKQQNQTNEIVSHTSEIFELNSVLVTSKHNMQPCCTSCGKTMKLVEGDVIFGDKWFHDACWKLITEVQKNV